MGFLLDSCGVPTVCLFFSGTTMGFLWGVNGISMGFLWGFQRMSMGLPWDFYGVSEGMLWEFNGILMGFPLGSYEVSMAFL